MFFDNEDLMYNHEIYHVVNRDVCFATNLEVTPYGLRSVPTHTEDGIPIRKLYVSNLPPKTTRNELFGVFAQYGFIKSCWVKMGEKGPDRSPSATYAFVTYSDPADAYKALQAPVHEKNLRGRNLRISPADSWHQPSEDANGKVCWKKSAQRREGIPNELEREDNVAPETSTATEEVEHTENEVATVQNIEDESEECDITYNILDVLNRDCLMHILSFIPLRDLIRSERVSKSWKDMIQEYLEGMRVLKTSWWAHGAVTLTTAVLRRVLGRVGAGLARLHIDHHWSALNDRTAHTLGKFCPNLDELKVVGMNTKNWNPLLYGCKELKKLSFVSCNKLSDSSLVHLFRSDTCIESLTVEDNTHVTGLFLTGSNPENLNSLSFYNCYNLQGTVLCAAIDSLPKLTTLKIDVCPMSMWKIIPMILCKLPKLRELSLSEYMATEIIVQQQGVDAFCEALATLTELRVLNLSRNIYITNAVLKQVSQTCTQLESINVSCCNSRRNGPINGVGDEGVSAVWRGCPLLRQADVSYLAGLSEAGLAGLARLPGLQGLRARGNPSLSAAPLAAALASCHQMQEIDVCGCDNVSGEVILAAVEALQARPRPLALYLAGTAAASLEAITMEKEYPTHKLLTVNLHEDRSNPHLRPDFVDRVFENGSEDSFDDLYDPNEYEDLFGSDDDLFMDDDLDEYQEAMYAYGYHAQNILIL